MLQDLVQTSTFFNSSLTKSKTKSKTKPSLLKVVQSTDMMKPSMINTNFNSGSSLIDSEITLSSVRHRPNSQSSFPSTPDLTLSPTLSEHQPKTPTNFDFSFLFSAPNTISVPEVPLFLVKHYQVLRKLGSGAFAEVYLSKSMLTGELVALKMISAETYNLNSFNNEVDIMHQLDHPNIVRLLDSFSFNEHLVLVQEYVPSGELLNLVANYQKELSEEAILQLFRQCVEAIAYMHENGYAHCDIKLENFLVDTTKLVNGVPVVKLCDFGLAISCSPSSPSNFRKCGSDEYIAPELIVSSDRQHDPRSSDIWSLGIILYALLVGQLPFTYDTPQARLKMFHRIAQGKINFPAPNTPGAKLLSEDLQGMVLGLLKANPRHRTPITDIFPSVEL